MGHMLHDSTLMGEPEVTKLVDEDSRRVAAGAGEWNRDLALRGRVRGKRNVLGDSHRATRRLLTLLNWTLRMAMKVSCLVYFTTVKALFLKK